MKVIITENQFSKILEQKPEHLIDYQSNSLLNAVGLRSDSDYNKVKKVIDDSKNVFAVDKHTAMTILSIGTAFIPLVGPFISAGIQIADAAMYYNEGDKKTAGLVGAFAIIPGIGGLAAKMGIGKLSAKVLGNIGKKIGMGSKLTKGELDVANKVAKHRQLLQAEIKKLGDSTLAKQGVRKQLQKKAVKKGFVKGGAQVAGYGGATYGYNQTYDYFQNKNLYNTEVNNLKSLQSLINNAKKSNVKK